MENISICAAVIRRAENGTLIVVLCNRQFVRLTGRLSADMPHFPVQLDTLFAESMLPGLTEKLHACFSCDERAVFEQTLEIHKDGRWWQLSLSPSWSERADTCPSQILVTGFEVTKVYLTADKPDANASRYRAVVDLAYDAIVTMDSQHNITLFNRAAENLFGYSSAEVMGKPIITLMPEQYRADHPQKVQQFADSYKPTLRHTTPPRMDGSNSVYGKHRDGSVIPVEVAVSKIDFNGGIEFIAVVRDITDRARFIEHLKKQAATDMLTGLPNRREFLEFLEEELKISQRLSVFILDIDCFKDINDRYGHDAGDEVLRVLAKVSVSTTEGMGLFARWGGEEFVAAMPGADANLAYIIADELRQRYERGEFAHAWRLQPIPFTVSIGVVAREPGEADVEALMKRADRALYRAKKGGRNRVEIG